MSIRSRKFTLTVLLLIGFAAIFYFDLFLAIIGNGTENAETNTSAAQLTLTAAESEVSEVNLDSQTLTVVQVGEEDIVLYSQPDTGSDVITTVTHGEYLEYIDEINSWYHVVVNDQYEGYISSLYSEKAVIDVAAPATSLKNTTVVLDPGHGGQDTGAISNNGSFYEKDITLATAKIIKNTLEAAGCTVLLTRNTDATIDLEDICSISMQNQADFFISLHYDSTEYMNEASGTTTYYYYEKYEALAEAVNDSLKYMLPLDNRGVEVGNFHVLRENTRPALLLELGYMNNDYDLAAFTTENYQQQVAEGILDGMKEYLAQENEETGR
ncbi:N-acetylmuramoyl-L-alanine amidase [Enterococcus sp. LJL51]|uniref:N-acetylmuramoyl-L-alanine amidase n=1 Tax=Enterococcus sp. LJL51 TaxID=3416656 RepID=UPI003CED1D70